MRRITPLLIVSSILLSLIACQKEESLDTLGISPGTGGSSGGGGTTKGTEVGTWKYLYTKQVFSQTVEADAPGIGLVKSVSSADYTTINNTGTVKFDGATAAVTDLAMSVDAVMKVSSYLGGVSLGFQNVPITGSIPASSYTSTYKKIGTDSLYFADGLIDLSGSGVSSAAGYKLKWDGDKMTLTNVFDESTAEVVNGISTKIVEHTVTAITLQKQ